MSVLVGQGALLLGVPVFHCCPRWIGAPASTTWTGARGELEAAQVDDWRDLVFDKVSRGTWRTDEIESEFLDQTRYVVGGVS